MAEGRDQRVRLVVAAALAAAAGVGIVYYSRQRRKAKALGISGSGAPVDSASAYSSAAERADSTQPANSRWSGSSGPLSSEAEMPSLIGAASADGGKLPARSPEMVRQDAPTAHTWVAFESTGQLAAAAAAAASAPHLDTNSSSHGEVQQSDDLSLTDGAASQLQKRVLPPEDTAARAQARSNLASIYSTVGASLPPKALPKAALQCTMSPLPTTAQPSAAASYANTAAAVTGTAAPKDEHAELTGAAQQQNAMLPPSVGDGDEHTVPLWQRLLALTAAGVEADDERDDERDNNDTDAGPHEVSFSSDWKVGADQEPVSMQRATGLPSAQSAPLRPVPSQVGAPYMLSSRLAPS